MTRNKLLETFLDTPAEVHAEPHYFKGGYIAGTLIRWGAAILIISNIT